MSEQDGTQTTAKQRSRRLRERDNYIQAIVMLLTREAILTSQAVPHQARQIQTCEWSIQCSLIRDIFGNPFRPETIYSAWLTPRVVIEAQAIYDERAFERMPVLGDALEDAGCTNVDIVQHCRRPAEHVRGCWAVDLVLGKG